MKATSVRTFDPNLKIETERLLLRPFTLADLDHFSLICADSEVMRFIGTGKPLDRETVQQQMMSWIASYKEQGFGLLALTLKDNKNLLGFCGLLEQTVDGELYIELGYRLERASWGKGIATEAAKAIRDYAFKQLGLTHLISIIQIDNIASKKVVQKVGMEHLKRTHFKDVLVDVFHMKSNLECNTL
ncbi:MULTISPECIES: GNAT family N-acetyltransferase [Legionella]|uniref:GNAT family N-acetyltransferase n=1 Tax=Legionella resiliens TaxID=2905958 RepID=A0ABS8X0Y9_9GAMM|nr:MULTISPECIES: GNAT family N-acetyltransferase [unclassified Legionella]MCE0723258.1 GNAT family N-acetyltransferase [Legionella sp. 9fVS26]MCE3532411.1 GNAT family N-acetyltransferase [Legionella sp. 8cVS16]QLZ68551.1 N-acetyltransferase [Legionella sp. PC1000]